MASRRSSKQSQYTAAQASKEEPQEPNPTLFPIVGIAASAGGLEAFTNLLRPLPNDTGMAFVLIQHLDPNHKSLLTEILSRTTAMPVCEVQAGMAIAPNQVYIIPTNTKMTLVQEKFHLAPREKVQGKYMPGDAFFVSLAAERGNKAIAVVLSGMDGDGAQGLRTIKVAGGITFAQCESSAQFESMPNTAIATGDVDFILPPAKIAEELVKISRHPYITQLAPAIAVEALSEEEATALSLLFTMLRNVMGVDFTHYKPSTLQRRIQRRMALYKLERLEDYVTYLQDNSAEVKALYQEILINVTSFFRDPESFEVLKQRVFPTITQGKSEQSPIRIWVPGCATGEEVYSIAICLMEFLEGVTPKPLIQFFATDISERSIDTARTGIYSETQMVNVSPERLRRFFIRVEGGYQISKAVRERCVFAKQNLISDPPFSNLDLVSCRNVMIYLGLKLQQQVIPLFHYSLNPTGFLMLGTSEGVGEFTNLFALLDKKYKVYARKAASARLTFDFVSRTQTPASPRLRQQVDPPIWSEADVQKEADRIVLSRYAPVGVLTNSEMEILQFRGDTSPYLRPASGKASLNLFKMARAGLLPELRTTIHQARQQDIPFRQEGLRIEGNGSSRVVNIEVIPFKASPTTACYFLVLFEDAPPRLEIAAPSPGRSQPASTDVERENTCLKQELAVVKGELAAIQDYLQATDQEQEATSQDLRVANEEILSSNEELQSTNEELQTAKEEIQATNEELNTTNEELQSRNRELHRVNNDLSNLLGSVNIPILMLADDLSIRRFTPTAQKLFNLIPTDVGRSLSHIRPNLHIANLETLVLEVIDTLTTKELEVQDLAGHWYDLRIRPYKTTENQIDGAVLALVDIDALKRTATQLEAARDYAEAIVETVRDPLLVLNDSLQVVTANRAFYELFRVLPSETEQRSIFELGNGQWNIPELRSLLEDIFTHNVSLRGFEVEHDFERIGYKTMVLNAHKVLQSGDSHMILLAIEDITQQKQFEAELAQLIAQEQSARAASEAAQQMAEAANRAKDEFLSMVSHELRNPLNAMLGWTQMLRNDKLDAAKTAQALAVIERSARTQNHLINDLLDITRINSGTLRISRRPLNLDSVIEAAIESVYPSANAKKIQITSMLDRSVEKVFGDAERLQQVIWNLLTNAIKFTPEGGQVEIRLESVEMGLPQAQITIQDTGQGIPADLLPHIFERFRQAEGAKTRTSDGLGLGLALVRHLVELHGGTVEAQSLGQGQGTTITVRLPLQTDRLTGGFLH